MEASTVNCSWFCITGKDDLSSHFSNTIVDKGVSPCCWETPLPVLSKTRAQHWEIQRNACFQKKFTTCFLEGSLLRVYNIAACASNTFCCFLSPFFCLAGLGCATSNFLCSFCLNIFIPCYEKGEQAENLNTISQSHREWAKCCLIHAFVFPSLLCISGGSDLIKCPFGTVCSEGVYALCGQVEWDYRINQYHNMECLKIRREP